MSMLWTALILLFAFLNLLFVFKLSCLQLKLSCQRFQCPTRVLIAQTPCQISRMGRSIAQSLGLAHDTVL